MAVMVQMPTPVPVTVLPTTEQLDAPAVTAYETVPVPVPPLVDRVVVPL